MWIIFIFLIAGIFVGFIFIKHKTMIAFSAKSTPLAVFFLIFFLGYSVGQNDQVMNTMGSLGWQALLLSLGSILGSLVLAGILYLTLFRSYHEK